MDDNHQFNWMPIDALPLFKATIEVILDETETQYLYIYDIKNNEDFVEQELIERISNAYLSLIDKAMYYEAQLQQWTSKDSVDKDVLSQILDLKLKNASILDMSKMIIEITYELNLMKSKHFTKEIVYRLED